MVKLQLIDSHWRERSAALNELRQGSHLRGYAQESHKQEYKHVGHALLSKLLGLSNAEFTRVVMTVRIQTQQFAVESASASATQNQPPHLRGAAWCQPLFYGGSRALMVMPCRTCLPCYRPMRECQAARRLRVEVSRLVRN